MTGSTMTRRGLLAGGAALLGGVALTSCSGTAAASRPTLDYWHLMSGGDGVNMATMVNQVNAEARDYRVKQTVLAWGAPYYTKLAMASVGGRSPDTAIMHASRTAAYIPGGLLEPWDLAELEQRGISKDTFTDVIWEKAVQDGELWTVPLDSHPFVFMFNTDIADEAGLLDSDGRFAAIDSPEGFLDAMREMGGVTGGRGFSYGYLNDGAQMFRFWYTLYRQQGAEMRLTGRTAQIEEDAAVTAFEFMQSILDDDVATRAADGGTAEAEFIGGEVGATVSGVWAIPTLRTAEVPFDAQPIPTMFGTDAAYADSHVFVLPRQAQVDERQRARTYDFVAGMLKDSQVWAEAGHIPAYTPIIDTPEYQELLPQANYSRTAEIINYDPVAWFTGSGSDFQNYFLETCQSVLLSGADAATGIRAFEERLNALLAKPNPVTVA